MEKIIQKTANQTRQRDSERLLFLLELLRNNYNHPDAQTCYKLMKSYIPSIGRSTVYRHLATLVKDGLINEIKFGDKPTRYDATTQSHGHFLCTDCHCMLDIYPIDINAKYPGILKSSFYIAKGVCNKCINNI